MAWHADHRVVPPGSSSSILFMLSTTKPQVKPSIFLLSSPSLNPNQLSSCSSSSSAPFDLIHFAHTAGQGAHDAATMQSLEVAPSTPAVSSSVATESAQRDAAAAEEGGKSPASPCMENERQIPVDPVSLRHLGMVADPDSPLSLPSVLTEVVAQSSPLLPPLRRPTFVGASLPCSAASSPVHGAAAKRDDHNHGTPNHATAAALRSLARQHSVALAHYVAAPAAGPVLSRNPSRAEGRSMVPHDDPVESGATVTEESFKCGALCMFIPGFSSKKKPASASAAAVVSSIQRQQSGLRRRSSVSRVASLERFECGSWSPPPPPSVPAVVVTAPHDADVALEVAKRSYTDDTDAPVKMAFVFDGEPEPRGILKKSASASQRQESAPRASSASQRHVRFSTAAAAASFPSSPCITPRLAKARAEFTAFLEAQSA